MNNKALLLVISVLCVSTANADQLTDQISSFEAAEQQNAIAARDLAKVQADFARQQSNLKKTEPRVIQMLPDTRGQYSNPTPNSSAPVQSNPLTSLPPPDN